MLVAVPKACPVHGGKLKNFDAGTVLQMPGVKQVLRVDDETVAVVATTFWRAKKALDALPIEMETLPPGMRSLIVGAEIISSSR